MNTIAQGGFLAAMLHAITQAIHKLGLKILCPLGEKASKKLK